MIPIGFKNGFCVLDLVCTTGTAQYGCGNMGITAGCGDIYSSGLQCQWVDITDVDTGNYILAIKVNWDQSPDALGHYEQSYNNNWAQVCIHISESGGQKSFTTIPNCATYVDCAGIPLGNSQKDCQGTCNGTAKMGDLNSNLSQEIVDAQLYVNEILNASISPTLCNDLNNDSLISVWDAALLTNCVKHGTNSNVKCMFPHGIINPTQTVKLRIDTLNIVQNYLEIGMLATNADVLAYEFNIHGINIQNVVTLVNPIDYPTTPDYKFGGNKVISISYIDSSISKSPNWQKLCRIYYTSINDTAICIENIVDIVNKNYEATLKQIVGPCVQTGFTGVEVIDQSNVFNVWPNPTKGILNLNFHYKSNSGLLLVNDVIGKTIISKQVNLNIQDQTLDLTGMDDGVYIISVKTEHGISSKRIVVGK